MRTIAWLVLLVSLSVPARAQETRARITGVVTDEKGDRKSVV